MRFDPKTRRYLEGDRALSPEEVKKHIDNYISDEQKEVDREAKRLLAGVITVAAFFAFMRDKVQAWHTITGVIAYGGKSQMNHERWLRINEKVQSELGYLAKFEAQAERSAATVEAIAKQVADSVSDKVPAGLEVVVEEKVADALATAAPSEVETVARAAVKDAIADSVPAEEVAAIVGPVEVGIDVEGLIGGQIVSRSVSYADAAWGTFINNEVEREKDEGVTLGRRICVDDPASCDECPAAATEEFIPLDDIPEIGSLQCMGNCRCEIEFEISGVQFKTSDLFQGVVGGQEAFGGDVNL